MPMMLDSEKYDWQTREDAETLSRYHSIKNDPERMRKAQECIKKSISDGKSALGDRPTPTVPSRKNNPATIKRMHRGEI